MLEAIRAKARCCKQFQHELKGFGKLYIFENDTTPYWAIGPDHQGNNIYGKLLMQVRDEINAGLLPLHDMP